MKDSWKLIVVGSRVAMCRRFLQSTGQLTGEVPFARGVVEQIGPPAGERAAIATVAWNTEELPPRTLISNLAPVTDAHGVIDDY